MGSSFLERVSDPDRILVAPSLLAADFARLGDEIRSADRAGADLFHLDVMDGHFVPNLTVGPLVMKAVRPATDKPVEAHLMIDEPLRYAPRFAEAGADAVTFHVETTPDPAAAADAIRNTGVAVGVSLNPPTPLRALDPLEGRVDYVLVMTVHPGFGGQAFLEDQVPKIETLAETWKVPVFVDGGIGPGTARRAVAAGARVLIAGTAVFKGADLEASIRAIRDAATAG